MESFSVLNFSNFKKIQNSNKKLAFLSVIYAIFVRAPLVLKRKEEKVLTFIVR